MGQETTQLLVEAINNLGAAIEKGVAESYTITGAADWPIIVVLGGVVIALIGFMWVDLKATMKDNRNEWKVDLSKETGLLWSESRAIRKEMKECKEKCCE